MKYWSLAHLDLNSGSSSCWKMFSFIFRPPRIDWYVELSLITSLILTRSSVLSEEKQSHIKMPTPLCFTGGCGLLRVISPVLKIMSLSSICMLPNGLRWYRFLSPYPTALTWSPWEIFVTCGAWPVHAKFVNFKRDVLFLVMLLRRPIFSTFFFLYKMAFTVFPGVFRTFFIPLSWPTPLDIMYTLCKLFAPHALRIRMKPKRRPTGTDLFMKTDVR